MSEETRSRMSKSAMGRVHSEETKLKRAKSITGRVVTETTRSIMSVSV